MADTETLQELRIKKIGILIYDARLTSQKTIEECARGMGVSVEQYKSYESGMSAPSLPEIESLAYFLNISLEHFWGQSLISENIITHDHTVQDRLQKIRHKMIGTQLRMKREEAGIPPDNIARKLNIDAGSLEQYENGQIPIPLPLLENISKILSIQIHELFDKSGPIGNWRSQQTLLDQFMVLPDEQQQFICNPKNRPYLQIAIQLSSLPYDAWLNIQSAISDIITRE